jgi:hypothetical protein
MRHLAEQLPRFLRSYPESELSCRRTTKVGQATDLPGASGTPVPLNERTVTVRMMIASYPFLTHTGFALLTAACLWSISLPGLAANQLPPDKRIAEEIVREPNLIIIEEFLKQELYEVNNYAAKPLLGRHPSLSFFIKQANGQPLQSLFFLESQLPHLLKAQRNIDSFPYSISLSAGEKQKILSLKPVAERTMSYGIPMMKRYFYRLLEAARTVAEKRGKHPMELMPDPGYRDAVFRQAAPTAKDLDSIMGNIAEGEQATMALGWTLEDVTVTRWWLTLTENTLPTREDFAAFRKKRSEYFLKRLKRIYGTSPQSPTNAENHPR